MIKISDEKLDRIISESIDKVLNEIDYRTAALAGGANYNADQAKHKLRDKNVFSKMNASNNIRLEALSLAVHDKMPNLELHFMETSKERMSYEVIFKFYHVQYIDNKRMVFSGEISLSGGNYQKGYLEYNFEQQLFYRVSFYGKGTIRRTCKLENDEDMAERFNEFLSLISNFMYSEDDYISIVDTNGPTLSKKH